MYREHKHIFILAYWPIADALVQTYTLPYVRIIKKYVHPDSLIYLSTLEIKEFDESQKSALLKEGIVWKPLSYKPFGLKAIIYWIRSILSLTLLIRRKGIGIIHCWCTPAGAIGYILSLLTQRSLIIDSFEPHAEAMVENGTWKRLQFGFKLLFWLEKKQMQRAKTLIAATKGMKEYAELKYGKVSSPFYVKPACVNLDLFSKDNIKKEDLLERLGLRNKVVGFYAGKFGGIYLDLEVFEFFKVAYDYWGDRFAVLLLTGHNKEEIYKWCSQVGLPENVITIRFVPHHQVPMYMGLADFAICPVKPVPTKKYCTPIKNGEYWALGLPVVIPQDISDDAEIIREFNAGYVLKALSEEEYRKAIKKIDDYLGGDRNVLYQRIVAVASRFRSFSIADEVYKKVYLHNNIWKRF